MFCVGWSDIGYSFVVGEDGNVYEARGWDKVGAHTHNYNHNGIGMSYLVTFLYCMHNIELYVDCRMSFDIKCLTKLII
jgi:hypothetical protein